MSTELELQHCRAVCKELQAELTSVKMARNSLDDLVNDKISRSVDIENYLLAVAEGKAPPLSPRDCRIMALRLGTPRKHWTDVVKNHKWKDVS